MGKKNSGVSAADAALAQKLQRAEDASDSPVASEWLSVGAGLSKTKAKEMKKAAQSNKREWVGGEMKPVIFCTAAERRSPRCPARFHVPRYTSARVRLPASDLTGPPAARDVPPFHPLPHICPTTSLRQLSLRRPQERRA